MLPTNRLIFLGGVWFVLAIMAALLFGARLKRRHVLLSAVWLGMVLAVGDFLAYRQYRDSREILVLTAVALRIGILSIWRLPDWNPLGQVAWTMALIITPLFLMYAFDIIRAAQLKPDSFLVAMVFIYFQTVASLVALTHMYDNLEISCRVRWPHRIAHIPPNPDFHPMVSLHLPAFDEPPEVVEKTLRALAVLDYPAYEVIVIDNNTPREETWRPVEALCRKLGPRFRFYHIDNCPGYKSGALNIALAHTSPEAELIGVVDADYLVDSDFLREMVPVFTDPKVAFIQAPQDYRDYNRGGFSEAIYYSYEYFFEISMPVRNERNAIIFSGTMGLVRKSVMQEIGGWSEWCITEDAEASLRILKRGYKALYYHRSMGRGLMPCTFSGLKKQRFRWCFGNIQILRRHWESLMPWAHWLDPENHLTPAQKYFYFTGGLQWFTDAFNFAFVIFLFAGGMIKLHSVDFTILPVTETLVTISAVFMLLNLWRFGWVLRHAMNLSWNVAFRSMYAMFSVGWVVALASFQAMFQSRTAFLRTPKIMTQVKFFNALFDTHWETVIGLLCAVLGILVLVRTGLSPDTFLISGLLLWQASLYLAAPIYSLFYRACPD